MTRLILTVACLALAGCATPESRVRTALMNAGLNKPVANCMAGRMVDRLSLWQLNKLRGLQKLRDKKVRELTIEEFVKRSRALQDPEILAVISSSAVVCALDG
jgi:hypothetical protein